MLSFICVFCLYKEADLRYIVGVLHRKGRLKRMLYMICNPAAGSGRARAVGTKAADTLKNRRIPCRVCWTEYPGHATQLAREAAEAGAETVLSVGGDGTAFEVARGLIGTETALGVIPAGTGNDFIKTIGLPQEPEAALDFILSHPAVRTDAGEINGQLFLNEIGAGFDVSVLDYAAKAKKYVRGLLPYLYGVLRTLFRFHSVPITYARDGGEPVTEDAFVVGVANGGVIGGGIVIAPEARVDDGLMDVVIVGRIPGRKLLGRLIGLMRGRILTFPETTYFRASSVSFSVPDHRINVDGEILSFQSVEARVLPAALKVHRSI